MPIPRPIIEPAPIIPIVPTPPPPPLPLPPTDPLLPLIDPTPRLLDATVCVVCGDSGCGEERRDLYPESTIDMTDRGDLTPWYAESTIDMTDRGAFTPW